MKFRDLFDGKRLRNRRILKARNLQFRTNHFRVHGYLSEEIEDA